MKIEDILKRYQNHPDLVNLGEGLKESSAGKFHIKGIVVATLQGARYIPYQRNTTT